MHCNPVANDSIISCQINMSIKCVCSSSVFNLIYALHFLIYCPYIHTLFAPFSLAFVSLLLLLFRNIYARGYEDNCLSSSNSVLGVVVVVVLGGG